MPRFFAEICDARQAVIRGKDAGHILGPLRKQPGDTLRIRDAHNGYTARILSLNAREIRLEILERYDLYDRSRRIIHLGVALIPPADMDDIIRFATELGVADIQPVICARSNIRRIHDARQRRWEEIILEAVKQCERRSIPSVKPTLDLDTFAAAAREGWPTRLVALPDAAEGLEDIDTPETGILIGPEGGLAPHEIERLLANGFRPVHMGRTTLRAVTAAMAAAAILGKE